MVTADSDSDAQVPYETPSLTDLGSIADHTFGTPSGHGHKDFRVCGTDKFGEYSCSG